MGGEGDLPMNEETYDDVKDDLEADMERSDHPVVKALDEINLKNEHETLVAHAEVDVFEYEGEHEYESLLSWVKHILAKETTDTLSESAESVVKSVDPGDILMHRGGGIFQIFQAKRLDKPVATTENTAHYEDAHLRQVALDLAIRYGTETNEPHTVVERAQAYLSFLKGSNS